MTDILQSCLSQLAGLRIDIDCCYFTGIGEITAKFGPDSECAFHKLGPYWRGGGSARQSEVRIVVKSNPDYAYEIGCLACKPALARASSLTGCDSLETHLPDSRSRTTINHVSHH